MPVLAAYMVPHPPMIVPEVGHGDEHQEHDPLHGQGLHLHQRDHAQSRQDDGEQGQEAHSLVVAVEFGKDLKHHLVPHNTEG